jgi:hypothetical protein
MGIEIQITKKVYIIWIFKKKHLCYCYNNFKSHELDIVILSFKILYLHSIKKITLWIRRFEIEIGGERRAQRQGYFAIFLLYENDSNTFLHLN